MHLGFQRKQGILIAPKGPGEYTLEVSPSVKHARQRSILGPYEEATTKGSLQPSPHVPATPCTAQVR